MNDSTKLFDSIDADDTLHAHELPFARLMDELGRVQRRIADAAPDAAEFIAAEFGALEDAVAELATELTSKGWKAPEPAPSRPPTIH